MFINCSNLKTIVIPNKVLEIWYNSFQNCTSLTSVYISKNIISIDDEVFLNCTNLKDIYCLGNAFIANGPNIFLNVHPNAIIYYYTTKNGWPGNYSLPTKIINELTHKQIKTFGFLLASQGKISVSKNIRNGKIFIT
jgi:hypothetical protein